MRNNSRTAGSPTELSQVLSTLQKLNRDLERMHYSLDEVDSTISASDDQLLKVAKSLAFIWKSRKSFVDENLMADPGWLILLSLKIAELSNDRLQISTVCIDSGSPSTTGLRWIKLLESKSIIKIEPDLHDGRRKFVFLTESTSDKMARYLMNVHNFINTQGFIY